MAGLHCRARIVAAAAAIACFVRLTAKIAVASLLTLNKTGWFNNSLKTSLIKWLIVVQKQIWPHWQADPASLSSYTDDSRPVVVLLLLLLTDLSVPWTVGLKTLSLDLCDCARVYSTYTHIATRYHGNKSNKTQGVSLEWLRKEPRCLSLSRRCAKPMNSKWREVPQLCNQ